MKLFIVEDDQLQSLILEKIVQNLGHEVAGIEQNGKEAVKKIKKYRPDAILMDILLKDNLDGISVTQEVKKTYQPFIIYVTGNSDDANRLRAEQFGFHDYLIKPVTISRLSHSIQSIAQSQAGYN